MLRYLFFKKTFLKILDLIISLRITFILKNVLKFLTSLTI